MEEPIIRPEPKLQPAMRKLARALIALARRENTAGEVTARITDQPAGGGA